MRRLFDLFWTLFKISLFVIGGGYAILVVADDVFAKKGWTEEGELTDHLPVFQMVPGIIATHTAVYIGRKVAGGLGAAVAVAAVILPSIVIFTFVAAGFGSIPTDNPWLESCFTGLRAALTGVIAATIIRGWKRNLNSVFSYGICAIGLTALCLSVPVWMVLVGAMVAGCAAQAATSIVKFRSPSWLALLLFFKYGALCFGGGFVLVPMYLEDFVGAAAPYLHVSEGDFSTLMALTQMTPGPIAINGATYFGYHLAGLPGVVFASLALLLPGSILMFVVLASLDRFRQSRVVQGILKGVRPASVALMIIALAAFAKMCLFTSEGFYNIGSFNVFALLLVAAATAVSLKKKMSPMALVFACALLATVARV